MIKILYLCESLNRGGAEQLLLTTLKYLDPSGFSAVVCCIGKKGEIGREIEDLGFKVIELNRKLHICNLAAIFHLAKVLREEKPDILHTHLYFANIFGRVAAKLAGVRRVITTLHNPDYSYEDNGRWTYKVRKAMDKYSGKLCNSAFIAVSGYVKNDFQRQLGFENIKVLHNYLEIDRFKTPQLSEIRRKRDELGVSPDEVLLLNIGRLHPQKGQAQLIDAFAMLCRDHPKAKLAIVGKGVLKNELKDKARALGISSRVMFLENRKDIPEIIHASDIFVFPSLYEGFGIAMAEAMASAKPVIASNIEALKEMARDGVDAILVENNNCAKLSEEISGLIRDRARQIDLGESARNRAASLFEAARQVRNLEQIYRDLVYDGAGINLRCIVCGGSSFKRSIYGGYCYRDKKYDIVRCRKCGFMFLSPQPGKDVLNSIYNADDYFKDYYATRAGLKNYIEGMSDFEGSDKTALSLILKIKKTGRLLDIGCAAGRFLNNARQVGFEVCGVEPNQKLADYAKKVYGLSVECATLDNAHLAKDSFDVIHAGDVLEHLPGLKENIDLIKSLLKRGGILFINQSFSYNKSFFNLCLKINMLFKKNRYSRNPPTHLWEFNPRTMKRFLRNNGFNIIYSKTAESAAPMPCGSKGTREVLRRYAKNISWSISNSPLLERLHLGDRGIIICKK